MTRTYAAYIMTNVDETAFKIGVTNDLVKTVRDFKWGVLRSDDGTRLSKIIHFQIFETLEKAQKEYENLREKDFEALMSDVLLNNPNHIDLSKEWAPKLKKEMLDWD